MVKKWISKYYFENLSIRDSMLEEYIFAFFVEKTIFYDIIKYAKENQ